MEDKGILLDKKSKPEDKLQLWKVYSKFTPYSAGFINVNINNELGEHKP